MLLLIGCCSDRVVVGRLLFSPVVRAVDAVPLISFITFKVNHWVGNKFIPQEIKEMTVN